MTNQPKPAPTAEEQLPPLELIPEDTERAMKAHSSYGSYPSFQCRERQLLAAVRSNRDKDAQLAEWERKYEADIQVEIDSRDEFCKKADALETKLAEKGAKIAELERQVAATKRGPEFYAYTPGAISDVRLEGMIDETRWWKVPGDEVYEVVREFRDKRAALRAVSEAAKEKPDRKDHGSYYCASVDSLLSRIGKLAE